MILKAIKGIFSEVKTLQILQEHTNTYFEELLRTIAFVLKQVNLI